MSSSKTLTKLLADMKTYQTEYESLMVAYKTAQENYNAELKKVTNSKDRISSDFISIPQKTWQGDNLGLATKTVDLNSCLQSCVSNAECSGATYDSTVSTSSSFTNCSLIKGNGTINTDGNSNKTAIVPKLSYYLSILNKLNSDLIMKMNQMRDTGNLLLPYLNDSTSKLNSSDPAFRTEYDNLMEQKRQIAESLKNYNSIESLRNENYNFVHNENSRLRLWAIIALFVVLYIIKYFLGLDSPSINAVFGIIVFLTLGLGLSNPIGFATMGGLLLVFLLLAII